MNAKRASVILGVFMAVILIGSTFLQLISRNTTTTQTVVPTATAVPTFPPPPNTADLDFGTLYLHPTNIFAIAQPTGFDQASPSQQVNLAQVNLVNNAIQYTPPGGRIDVGLRCLGGQAEITVADTGHGIDPEDLPYIFDRFYRGDKARQRTDAGASGLGLAIAKAIVEAHGGAIAIESTAGQGTTFTIALPAA